MRIRIQRGVIDRKKKNNIMYENKYRGEYLKTQPSRVALQVPAAMFVYFEPARGKN